MNAVIGNVLRAGVVLSAGVILFGVVLLLFESGSTSTAGTLTYYPNQVPHGSFDVSLSGLVSGLAGLQPFSIIELGALVLLSTPVTRVLISIFLFALEGDRIFVYVTSVVLVVLLFSIFATPLIPGFNA
ncbi:MAG TPA: DUF1634 domain-containing protein [Nitrososphaerales archaeon]|nr:DUF1634 domain-containing protein [Nitrososphaerales archaeon]